MSTKLFIVDDHPLGREALPPGIRLPMNPVRGLPHGPFPFRSGSAACGGGWPGATPPNQIAEALFMGRPTLERYLTQLLEKTGTTGTDVLLTWVHQQGLSGI